MHDEAAAFSGTGASSSASTSTECSNCSTPEQGHAGAGPSIPAELQKEKRKAEEKKLVRKKKSRPNSAGNDEPSVPSFYREPQLVFPSAPRSQDGAPRKTLTVYCDGSALGNGKKKARAGWGVFWGDEASGLSGLNEGRRLPGPVQTNNRAELMVSGRYSMHISEGIAPVERRAIAILDCFEYCCMLCRPSFALSKCVQIQKRSSKFSPTASTLYLVRNPPSVAKYRRGSRAPTDHQLVFRSCSYQPVAARMA